MKYVISLEVESYPTNVQRFAQNRAKTFDNSITVVKEADAKRFDNIKQAHGWLKRHNLYRRIPSPFCGWEIRRENS